VLGALLIGFIQSFNEGLLWMTPGGDWTRSLVFGILIAVLVFQADGHPRRANAGGSVTGLAQRARGIAGGSRNAWLVPLLIVLALIYPWVEESLRTLPVIGDFIPQTGSVVVMLAFTMMAIGLNIVVGYAGLLDLGYVAFYAVGAYTAGWFASQQFDQVTIHFGSSVDNDLPGNPSLDVARPDPRRLLTLFAGILIGLPTLRLRGDYLAIVTLGSARSFRRWSATATASSASTSRTAPSGSPRSTRSGFPSSAPSPAGQLPEIRQPRVLVLPDRADPAAAHRVLLGAAAGLAPRPCVDRDPRGRDGRSRDGRAADADEDLGVRDRRLLRGRRRRLLRELQVGAFPADFYFNFSVFLLCMVILGGMGSVWGVIVGGLVLSYLDARAWRRSVRRSRMPG